MKLNEQLWREHQYSVLVSFVHHLAYWRTWSTAFANAGRHSEMWIRSTDAHLLRAVIDWCMVFGADSNEVHWKNVASDEPARESFRSSLIVKLALSADEWRAYWSGMTRFRNEFAAHRIASGDYPIVPQMDIARQVAVAYDDWFRKVLSGVSAAVFEEPTLSERFERVMRTSESPVNEMIAKAPTADEEYEGCPPSTA